MRKLNLLIPSVHRPTHPSLIQCLRNNGEREVRIIGVDMNREGIGCHIADVFYQVPPRNDPTYIERMLEISKKESVDVYYALGEEEAISSSENKSAFTKIGTSVITPGTSQMLTIATNKCLWHDFFDKEKIPHANYRTIDSKHMIETAAYELGYPKQDIIIKPAISKGGRGSRLITSKDISQEYYTETPGEIKMSLESFITMMSPIKPEKFKQLIAMEYLPGTFYSVDVLSQKGRIIYAIPKIQIVRTASNDTIAQVDMNPEVIDLARQACEAFDFSYLNNYEMKLNKNDQPRIYDINPRGGASLGLCSAAGVNIVYYAVKMAVGEDIPQKSVKDKTMMIRFYNEVYI